MAEISKSHNMNKKILSLLQDKTKDFGLSAKVIEELAEQASKDVNEESSDEDLTKVVDSFVSIAKMMQGEVTRKMQKRKTETDRDDEGQERKEDKHDDEPAWFAAYRKEQDAKLAKLQSENDAMKAEKAKADRGALIASTAKKLGIPESLMKRYRVDDGVDVEKDLMEYKQDLVNNKLLPKDSGGDKASRDAQLKSDAEAWVDSLPDIN